MFDFIAFFIQFVHDLIVTWAPYVLIITTAMLLVVVTLPRPQFEHVMAKLGFPCPNEHDSP